MPRGDGGLATAMRSLACLRWAPTLLLEARREDSRFAVNLQRKQRARKDLRTELTDIPGIGPKRQRALLKYFGSLNKIKAATLAELRDMPGLPGSVAERVYRHYQDK